MYNPTYEIGDIIKNDIDEYFRCASSFSLSSLPQKTFTVDIKKVIFNKPATIVFWADGTKTVVKCADFDIWDPEKGLAMAICKRVYGDEFHKIFKDYIPEEDTESEYPNIPLSSWFNDFMKTATNLTINVHTNKEDK